MPLKKQPGPKTGVKAKPKPRAGRPKGSKVVKVNTNTTPQQEMFINEYLINMSIKESAEKVGISQALGSRWLNPDISPHVYALLRRKMQAKEAIAEHTADEVLRLLQTGAFLDYRPWFKPGNVKCETWRIHNDEYLKLPVEIARLIKYAEEEIEYKDNEAGVPVATPTGWLEVQLMDREILIAMVAKYMLGDKLDVRGTVLQINWGELRKGQVTTVTSSQLLDSDPIEAEILAVREGKSIADKPPIPVPVPSSLRHEVPTNEKETQ